MAKKPPAPSGLKTSGSRLWKSVLDDYELEEHEMQLLREACRTVDLLDDLEARVRLDGPIIDSPQGEKAHPAAVEARQQRIALARLLAVLRLPTGDEEDVGSSGRPQRRVGVRRPYVVSGSA